MEHSFSTHEHFFICFLIELILLSEQGWKELLLKLHGLLFEECQVHSSNIVLLSLALRLELFLQLFNLLFKLIDVCSLILYSFI